MNKPKKQIVDKQDGWANLLTGLGSVGTDRRMSTNFQRSTVLIEQELTDIYNADGMGRRIVDIVVDDMVRQWFTVTGDTDDFVNKDLKAIHGKKQIRRSLAWASLYGGSLAVIGIDDGGEYKDPVREAGIRQVTHIHVYDRFRITVPSSDLYNDTKNSKYGEPMLYTVSPISGSSFRVHESRTMRFEGMDVSDITRNENNGWSNSDLAHVYERIRGIGEAYADIEHILGEFIIGALTIDNLAELISTGKESLVIKRMHLLDMTKHILNTMVLDKEETFNRITSPVSGLRELMDKLVQGVSAATAIPVTVLMGESPAGLNATGASDVRRYYDMVKARQEERMLNPVEKLIRYVMLAKQGSFKGRELPNWQIEFKPLWQPTENEIVTMRYQQAQTDQIYLQNAVLQEQEVRESRFGGEKYSIETKLGKMPTPPKEESTTVE